MQTYKSNKGFKLSWHSIKVIRKTMQTYLAKFSCQAKVAFEYGKVNKARYNAM